MIAPILPEGLALKITGELGSKPYIEMTLKQMEAFGVKIQRDWENMTITVFHQKYEPVPYTIESDWSGASYWFAAVALSEHHSSSLELLGLKENSLQGDAVITEIMNYYGVKSEYTGRGFKLTKISRTHLIKWDFTNCPDLAQTVCVVAAALQCPLLLTGIESLKVKETDRIIALQKEIKKMGTKLDVVEENHSYFLMPQLPRLLPKVINTYDDHRMAMAFAPLACMMNILIEDPDVVAKSYPSFWEHFELITGTGI